MHRKYRQLIFAALALTDAAVTAAAMALAWWLRLGSGLFPAGANFPLGTYMGYLVGLIPLFWAMYGIAGLYGTPLRSRLLAELGGLLRANGLALLVLMAMLFLFKQGDVSRAVLVTFVLLNTVGGVAGRRAVRWLALSLLQQERVQRQVLVLGAGPLGQEFVRRTRDGRLPGLHVFAFLDDNPDLQEVAGLRVLGGLDLLEPVVRERTVDEVIIALPLYAYEKVSQVLRLCEDFGVHAWIIPDYLRFVPARAAAEDVDGLPIIDLRHIPLNDPLNRMVKRGVDLAVAAVGLLAAGPVMLAIALAIRLTSPGPVLFRQERVGLNRRRFQMLKFRTMHVHEGSDTTWTTADDPRRTRLGALLRRASLDELPQLLNVLRGDMSLVGPRPERPHFVEQFRDQVPKYMLKHLVRPGITGWAQVNGWRGDTSIAERIACDLYYIENWTAWLDFRIMWLTVWRGMGGKHAY